MPSSISLGLRSNVVAGLGDDGVERGTEEKGDAGQDQSNIQAFYRL